MVHLMTEPGRRRGRPRRTQERQDLHDLRMEHGWDQPEVVEFLKRYEEGRREATGSLTDIVFIEQVEMLRSKREVFLDDESGVDPRLAAVGYLEALATCLRLELEGTLPRANRDASYRRKIKNEKNAALAWFLETGGRMNVCCTLPADIISDEEISVELKKMIGYVRFTRWEPGEIKKLIGPSAWKTYNKLDLVFTEQPTWQLAKVGGGAQLDEIETSDWLYLKEALERRKTDEGDQ